MSQVIVNPIRTEKDHERALAEIERLFDSAPGSPEYDRLEVLSILVQAYEEEHEPIASPDPIDAIQYAMESRGLDERDLEPYIGSRSRVWEILNKRRRLTLRMIRNLHHGLGIPAEVLIKEYKLEDGADEDLAESCEVTASINLMVS